MPNVVLREHLLLANSTFPARPHLLIEPLHESLVRFRIHCRDDPTSKESSRQRFLGLGERSGMSPELHFEPSLVMPGVGWTAQQHIPTEEETMVLATAKIGDFDRFWNTFSTKGAEKRKQHGCKGAHVFRDPNESHRVWAIFDWDEAGWQSFTLDPEVPAIFQEAGFTQGPPKSAEFLRQHDA